MHKPTTFIVENAIRQILRTPGKTILFLLLLALSVAFLTMGIDLWTVSVQSFETLENSFTTIGTVQQKPNTMRDFTYWDPWAKAHYPASATVYDRVIPVSAMDFEGANYIHPPEKRPFYGAYHESFVIHERELPIHYQLILEAEPLEDCIPSKPVVMRIKRILYGSLQEHVEEFLFCDIYDLNPAPLYAGKTYIMSLSVEHMLTYLFPEYEDLPYMLFYCPAHFGATQFDKKGNRIPAEIDFLAYEEVTEGYYDTPQGQRWQGYIESFEKQLKTIPVVPTNATRLLMDFYTGNAEIIDGRDISAQEYEAGSRVCLVQRGFARNNDLKVGDVIPLPMYYANYADSSSIWFMRDYYYGWSGGGALNAQGKSYPVFEEGLYEIVGIYSVLSVPYEVTGFASGWNMVVIPQASIENSDENNILAWGVMQAYNTSFEIPNGTIDTFVENWSRQNIDELEIVFYDKGYMQLKDGFERMRAVSLILMVAGTVVMLLVLTFFTFLFIIKNKKKTAIERSLGLDRKKCALSLACGMLLTSALGITVGTGTGYFLGGAVMQLVETVGEAQAFDTRFSSWVNNADKVAEIQAAPHSAGIVMFVTVATIVLMISVIFALFGTWRNLKSEPLKLLSTRLDE